MISPLTCAPNAAADATDNNGEERTTASSSSCGDLASAAAGANGGGGSNSPSPSAEAFLAASGIRFSGHTLDKATKAKVTLENYYSNLISQHRERKHRLQRLEDSLREDDTISEAQKAEKRQQHAVKETEYLRLKRSRLGVDDFEPLKVIGKGAFGEVRRVGGKAFQSNI